jgi:hypothetical protein
MLSNKEQLLHVNGTPIDVSFLSAEGKTPALTINRVLSHKAISCKGYGYELRNPRHPVATNKEKARFNRL